MLLGAAEKDRPIGENSGGGTCTTTNCMQHEQRQLQQQQQQPALSQNGYGGGGVERVRCVCVFGNLHLYHVHACIQNCHATHMSGIVKRAACTHN